MFMNEEKDERYIAAMEARNKIEYTRLQRSQQRLGLGVLVTIGAAVIWGIPLAVTLWRAAFGL